MISDTALVNACSATYDPNNKPFFEAIEHAVRIFLTKSGDVTVVSIEGTHEPIGWAVDFVAVPEEERKVMAHPDFDWLHAGFLAAALASIDAVRQIAKAGPYVINGHSLGAALAGVIGAMLTVEGLPPVKIGMFAPPRAGGDKLISVITSVPYCAYRYADDPIPCVPFTLRGFPYRQVPHLEQIGRASFARAIVDPFTYHHIARYVADVPLADPGAAA